MKNNKYSRGLASVLAGATIFGLAAMTSLTAQATGCPGGPQMMVLTVTPSKTAVSPGETITYCYSVKNISIYPIDFPALVDDNGTPGDPNDDFYFPLASLAPGEELVNFACRTYTVGISNGCIINSAIIFAGNFGWTCSQVTASVCLNPNDEGCSAGFWKTNTSKWVTYPTDTKLKSVFVKATDKTCKDIGKEGDKKFTDALGWGTSVGTLKDAFKNLMREAVAALLNAANPDIHYPATEAEIILMVNDALMSCDKNVLTSLANEFQAANNKGSSLCCLSACPTCVLGYPFTSSNPRTSVIFNESEVLAAFSPTVQSMSDSVKLWATDEHAILLGCSRTITKTAGGSVTNDFALTPLGSNPGSAVNPSIGDPSATDPAGRPLFPSLFITDITSNPTDKSGDWQYGGPATPPSAVFGTWKGCTNIIDQTVVPAKLTINTASNPATKNGWNLGAGSDTVPAGTYNLGYGIEVRWKISDLRLNGQPLEVGHTYRIYLMVHDGDQNKVGGDVGHACVNVTLKP